MPNLYLSGNFSYCILYDFIYSYRAVGCIFGELLNNSPLFPVSIYTVNVLKFRTLFLFCSQINTCYQGLNSRNFYQVANREDPDQTASSEAV